jgi:hypothetical protein
MNKICVDNRTHRPPPRSSACMRFRFGSVSGRWVRLGVLALAVGAGRAAPAPWVDHGREATLEAIHQLENPRNSPKPGARGELGAYQFRVTTWRMHTTLPFRRALERELSDFVAVRHYEWLKRGLERAGMRVSTYNIALAWNGGLEAAIRGRAPRAAHVYADRAANLAASFATRPGGGGPALALVR